jgi:hypothetical protein
MEVHSNSTTCYPTVIVKHKDVLTVYIFDFLLEKMRETITTWVRVVRVDVL